MGVIVFLVLLLGIILSSFVGIYAGSLSWLSFSQKVYEGFTQMNDIFLLALFTGGMASIVERLGGIRFVLSKIRKIIEGTRSAYLGIGAIVALTNFAIANNTISIIITGKIARKITEQHRLSPKLSASVLDIFSCIVQGIFPYGAQILIISQLSGYQISYPALLLGLWHIYLLLFFTVISVFLTKKR